MRIRPLRFAAAGLAASSLVLLTACGGSADAESKADAKKTPAPTSAAPTPAASEAPLSKSQVKAALLTVKDLPTGWSSAGKGSEEGEDGGDLKPGAKVSAACKKALDLMNGEFSGFEPKAAVDTEFQGPQGATLNLTVETHKAGEAQRAVKEVETTVKGCDAAFPVVMEGTAVKVRLTELSVPAQGDESHGFRFTVLLPDETQIDMDLAYARYGQSITAAAYLGSGEPAEVKAFEDVFKKSVTRLKDVTDGKIKVEADPAADGKKV
ncbi:hypothetical protein ACIO3O_19380 [Streptomyces sp. NPDC087440]|uniref:hypothetical protein n=1 Tax=Streptomyces sp. NPDC087440 TaxID=3365790 RepID=UPI00382025D9